MADIVDSFLLAKGGFQITVFKRLFKLILVSLVPVGGQPCALVARFQMFRSAAG